MDFLLSQGANPNGKAYETTAQISTPPAGRRARSRCHRNTYAASQGDRELVEHLVARGADLTLRDVLYNGTPDGWAKQYKHGELAQFLCEQHQARN